MPVLLIGTLDTKGIEFQFVRDLLRSAGVATLVLDAGVLQDPAFEPDISREQVYAAAGTSFAAIRQAADRGQAIAAAAKGAAKIAADLHAQGQLEGVLGLGGSAGTTIATTAMRALPFGVPKLMVSTLASGQVKPYVGVRDILMMNSVVDISGLNRVSRTVLANAAGAMIGMVRSIADCGLRIADSKDNPQGKELPLLTATMFGVTTPCVEAARAAAERAGFEVLVFHATGTGRHDDGVLHRRRADRRRARPHDDGTGRRAGRGHSHGGEGSADGGGSARRAAGHFAWGARHGQLRTARNGAGEVPRRADSISTIRP